MRQKFTQLNEWLQWQESLHATEIDLGLDRVSQVYGQLGIPSLADKVITVAGTNGKGSCVAFLEKLYLAAGYRTGSYTSPHLLRYNERISIAGEYASDEILMQAFEAVDQARGDCSLTYFEFGTLAAFYLFAQQPLDVVILEVGMGGRLDATNIINADVALITTIGLDHQIWLGSNRESIAQEKAGILRPGQYAVCGDRQPPTSLTRIANKLMTKLHYLGCDFDYSISESNWCWHSGEQEFAHLPFPKFCNRAQLDNIACSLKIAALLHASLPYTRKDLELALERYTLPGRCQIIEDFPEVWLDVAHNPQAAAVLADALASAPLRMTHFVAGFLADKDVAGIMEKLASKSDHWYLAAPQCARAMPVQALRQIAPKHSQSPVSYHDNIATAFAQARQQADNSDRIVVTGSFYTVAEVMAEHYRKRL